MAAATKRRTSTKKAKVEEPEIEEDLEITEDEVEDEASEEPAPKPKKAAAKKETKGTAWLVDHVNEKLGLELSGFTMRTVLRKMAKDGELDRESRSRYEFTGPGDPVVKAVIKHIKENGTGTRGSSEDKPAPAKKASTSKRKTKKAEPVEEEVIADDLDDLDELDLDD